MSASTDYLTARPAARAGRAMRQALRGAAALCFAAGWHPALAAPSCTFNTVAPSSFGVYDVFALVANNNGVGSLTIHCQGGGPQAVVALSTGQSNTYAPRRMKSGANTMSYNLYTSAGRTVVWGDGSGASQTLAISANSTTTLSIFGQIPAGQDAAVGAYSDSVTAVVNF